MDFNLILISCMLLSSLSIIITIGHFKSKLQNAMAGMCSGSNKCPKKVFCEDCKYLKFSAINGNLKYFQNNLGVRNYDWVCVKKKEKRKEYKETYMSSKVEEYIYINSPAIKNVLNNCQDFEEATWLDRFKGYFS